MSGAEFTLAIGLLASFSSGLAQSFLWFTVGAGLLLGVTLQIAAAVVAAYLVITTIPAAHPARRPGSGGTTGGARRSPHHPHRLVAA